MWSLHLAHVSSLQPSHTGHTQVTHTSHHITDMQTHIHGVMQFKYTYNILFTFPPSYVK